MKNKITDEMLQVCACKSLRTTSQSLTQLYNKLLVPTDLKITQFYMLATIYNRDAISVSDLSTVMELDQTTITRNISVLLKNNFVVVEKSSTDSRKRCIKLTELGFSKVHEATPIWYDVQQKIEAELGDMKFLEFLNTLERVQHIIDHTVVNE